MTDANKPTKTDVQVDELDTGAGVVDVSTAGAKEVIEETLGRKFNNVEDAKKAISEMKNLIGTTGKYKNVVEALGQKLELGGVEAVEKWVNEITKDDKSEVPILKDKVADLEFLAANPDMKEYLPAIKKIAKADNVSLEEAVKSDFFRDYLNSKKVASEAQKVTSVVETNNRVGFQTDEMKPLVDAYNKTPSERNAQILVEKALGLERK